MDLVIFAQHHDYRGRRRAACVAKQVTRTDQDSRSASHGAATSLIAMASIKSVTLEVSAEEPTEQPYGIRDCAFRDPAGNLVRIQELR